MQTVGSGYMQTVPSLNEERTDVQTQQSAYFLDVKKLDWKVNNESIHDKMIGRMQDLTLKPFPPLLRVTLNILSISLTAIK